MPLNNFFNPKKSIYCLAMLSSSSKRPLDKETPKSTKERQKEFVAKQTGWNKVHLEVVTKIRKAKSNKKRRLESSTAFQDMTEEEQKAALEEIQVEYAKKQIDAIKAAQAVYEAEHGEGAVIKERKERAGAEEGEEEEDNIPPPPTKKSKLAVKKLIGSIEEKKPSNKAKGSISTKIAKSKASAPHPALEGDEGLNPAFAAML